MTMLTMRGGTTCGRWLVGFCLLACCFAPPLSAQNLTLVTRATGIVRPTVVTHAGDGSGRLFIVEKRGRILTLAPGSSTPSLFLDISGPVDDSSNEEGLLGLAFAPDFADSGDFYLNYITTPSGTRYTHVSRFTTVGGVGDPNSEELLLQVVQRASNHNGGELVFGPDDGLLYISFGDEGNSNDSFGNGQNLATLHGAILRIDVSQADAAAGLPYAIPASNPFVGQAGAREEIYAYGLRNPWRMAFDDGPLESESEDRLFAGDVGQGAREEIDLIVAGGNYGWSYREGFIAGPLSNPPPDAEFIDPIADYGRSDGIAVIGGHVYRGTQFPSLYGKYIFADYTGGLKILTETGGGWTLSEPGVSGAVLGADVSSIGSDEGGELYATRDFGGTILHIQATPNSAWTAGGSGNWNSAGNWSSPAVPTTGADVLIRPTASLTVNGPAAGATVGTLGIGGASGAVTLQLAAGGTLSTTGITSVYAGSRLQGPANASLGGLIGAGEINLTGATLTVGAGNADTTFAGTVTGSGHLHKVGNATLRLTGEQTYTGATTISAGTLDLAGALSLLGGEIAIAGGATLRTANDITRRPISGAGTIRPTASLVLGNVASPSGFAFEGTLIVGSHKIVLADADAAEIAQVQLADGGELSSSATRLTDTLVSNGQAVVTGTFTNMGTVTVESGVLTFPHTVNGPGSYTGAGIVRFAGIFSPGNSPGVVELGNAELSNQLLLEIGGPTVGAEYDQLRIVGETQLGGALLVELIDGYQPERGARFQLIDSSGGLLSGSFAEIRLPPLGEGLLWQIDQSSAGLAIEAVPEPSAWLLALLGFLPMAIGLRGRRQDAARVV